MEKELQKQALQNFALNQKNALQEFAQKLGLEVHEKFQEDRRKTKPLFFLTKNGTSVSPVLDYENLNHFMLGWSGAHETIVREFISLEKL